MDFDPMDPGETEILNFDFSNQLAPGETLASASWEITVASISPVSDPSPASRLNGPAMVRQGGTIVYQKVSGPQAGVIYSMRALTATSQGNSLSLWAHLATNVL